MTKLRDEDREREEYICRVKAGIERHKKMCAELERACKNTVSEIWQQATKIDALMLEAEKPLTNGALKKENKALKEENERLKQVLADCEKKRAGEQDGTIVNMMRPQPCRKFYNASVLEWIAKLAEETHEVIQEATILKEVADEDGMVDHDTYGLLDVKKRLATELTDVITLYTSWLDAFGYDEVARGKLQERVNEKNKARGYWG